MAGSALCSGPVRGWGGRHSYSSGYGMPNGHVTAGSRARRLIPQPAASLAASACCRNSPLWDQEDLWQREGCATLTVVSMPFYWPPRANDLLYGHPLPQPQASVQGRVEGGCGLSSRGEGQRAGGGGG